MVELTAQVAEGCLIIQNTSPVRRRISNDEDLYVAYRHARFSRIHTV
jgi:hypothetical protein